MGFWHVVFGIYGGGEAAVVVVPSVPGAESALLGHRSHGKLDSDRSHSRLSNERSHSAVMEEHE